MSCYHQVLGQGTGAESKEGIGNFKQFPWFTLIIGKVSFSADSKEQRVNTGGIHGMNRFNSFLNTLEEDNHFD